MSHASNQSNLQPTNVIEPNKETTANVFCFAAFADKHTGVLYSNVTGTFPFMSLEGNVCFLVVYHYETNAILALPIKKLHRRMYLGRIQTAIQAPTIKRTQDKTQRYGQPSKQSNKIIPHPATLRELTH
jgi:hypothetical protein